MSIDPKKFGLSDSLVNAVNEALKGNQHKIDVAEPKGKITGADFKKLRGEQAPGKSEKQNYKHDMMKSEVADGNKSNFKQNMKEGSKPDFLDLDKDGNKKEPMKHAAKQTKEEVEQVDEISKATLGSYVKKASDSAATHTGAAAAYGSSSKSPDPKKMAQHQAVATKRKTGIATAVGKLTKEEAQVDEAAPTVAGANVAAQMAARKKEVQLKIAQKQAATQQAKSNKRLSGTMKEDDKCSCGSTNESKMNCEVHGGKHNDKDAKLGREPIKMNPPLREAGELPKKVVSKGHEIAKSLIRHKTKVDNPYAVGMAAAKKSAGIKD
jgi:hypothetical protein